MSKKDKKEKKNKSKKTAPIEPVPATAPRGNVIFVGTPRKDKNEKAKKNEPKPEQIITSYHLQLKLKNITFNPNHHMREELLEKVKLQFPEHAAMAEYYAHDNDFWCALLYASFAIGTTWTMWMVQHNSNCIKHSLLTESDRYLTTDHIKYQLCMFREFEEYRADHTKGTDRASTELNKHIAKIDNLHRDDHNRPPFLRRIYPIWRKIQTRSSFWTGYICFMKIVYDMLGYKEILAYDCVYVEPKLTAEKAKEVEEMSLTAKFIKARTKA